jgi:Domain of unknown function (DUF4936)
MTAATPVSGTRERSWFIYYRVLPGDLPRAVEAVRGAQSRLCEGQPGLRAALMQRAPAAGAHEPMTLLEIYSVENDWPAGRAAALPAAIEHVVGAAVAPWLQGFRHLEVFEPCA